MAVTTEIAPNIYRISVFAQWGICSLTISW
jgi:hypothetical protein